MSRTLVEIVRRGLIERRRDRLAEEIRQSQIDFEAGRCPARTTEEIVREILGGAEALTAHRG